MPQATPKLTGLNVEQIRFRQDLLSIERARLATASGIAGSTIDRLLSGDDPGISFRQLASLAKVLGVGVLTLFEPPGAAADQPTDRAALYRTAQNQDLPSIDDPTVKTKVKRLIIDVRRQRRQFLDLLEDEIEVPALDPPVIDRNDLRESARRIRSWLGWDDVQSPGASPTFDAFRSTLEARWVFVMRPSGYAGRWQLPGEAEIAGFCVYEETLPVIVVRRDDSESRQTFTLAHELAHLILHRDDFVDSQDDLYGTRGREREANAFAGFALLPVDVLDRWVTPLVDQMPTDPALLHDHFRSATVAVGVSTEVVLRRLRDESRIHRDVYDAYRKFQNSRPKRSGEGGSRAYRHREPLHLFGRPYVATVIEAWNQGELSSRSASRLLDNLKTPQLNQLREHVTGV